MSIFDIDFWCLGNDCVIVVVGLDEMSGFLNRYLFEVSGLCI